MMQDAGKYDPSSLAREAAQGAEDPTAPGRFSTSVLLALGAGSVCFVICLAGMLTIGKDTKLNALFVPGVFVFGVLTIAGFFKFLGQLISVPPGNRTTPKKAFKAFFYAIDQQRWDAAFACLSWVAKDGREIARPEIPEVELKAQSFTVSSPDDLKAYWDAFVGSFKSRGQRSFSYKMGEPEELENSAACVPVSGSITLDIKTAALGGKAFLKISSGVR